MSIQSTSLIFCLFLTEAVAFTDFQFVMDRNPNNYFCGHLQCIAAITDTDNEVSSFVDMTIYDITRVNIAPKVASVSIFQPDLYVDTTKSSAFSCTGVISRHQANLTVKLLHDIDCLYGLFKCQLNLVTVSGHSDVLTEIVIPEQNNSKYSKLADVSTREDKLAVLLGDQSVRVNTQTAEIKRLANIVDNKILPLIEQVAQVWNISERPGLNRREDKLSVDDHLEKPEAKLESVENLSNQTTIQGGIHANLSSTPTAEAVLASCDEGLVEFDKFCFGFSDGDEIWATAFAVCHVSGGQLVNIESQAKQEWIVEQMKVKGIDTVWIGGSRRDSEQWNWFPSLTPITGYTNWAPNQPEDPERKQCLQIRRDYQYKWVNINCKDKHVFVCEMRL